VEDCESVLLSTRVAERAILAFTFFEGDSGRNHGGFVLLSSKHKVIVQENTTCCDVSDLSNGHPTGIATSDTKNVSPAQNVDKSIVLAIDTRSRDYVFVFGHIRVR
jgi:hypothetical protein